MRKFGKKDVKVISREIAYDGIFKILRYHVQHNRFEGGHTKTFTREVFARGDASGVLLYDPDLEKVVLVEQFRPGVLEHDDNPFLIEVVAGMIDDNETPASAVIREAEEEAGVVIKDPILIKDYYSTPGGASERIYLYCARVDSSKMGGIYGHDHDNENIRLHILTLRKAMNMVEKNKIKNALAIIALYWLQRNRPKLRKLWQIKK